MDAEHEYEYDCTGELVPVVTPAQEPTPLIHSGDVLSRAKRDMEVDGALKLLALKHCHAEDIINMGGKPYATIAATMAFARVYGVTFKNLTITPLSPFRNEDGIEVLGWSALVTANWNGREQTEIGIATTADPFFQRKGTDGSLRTLPPSEVNVGTVMKKAITNAKGRATRAVLAISFTWEDVKRALGERAHKAGSVEYGGKSGERNTATGGGVMNACKQRIRELCLAIADHDKRDPSEILWDYTKFEGKDGTEVGVKNVMDRKFSDKWAASTLKKVEADFSRMQEELGGAE